MSRKLLIYKMFSIKTLFFYFYFFSTMDVCNRKQKMRTQLTWLPVSSPRVGHWCDRFPTTKYQYNNTPNDHTRPLLIGHLARTRLRRVTIKRPKTTPLAPYYFFAEPKMADKATSKPIVEDEENEDLNSIRVCGMQFAYEGEPPLFADFNLKIPPGSRCLLVGANGSG